MAQTQKPSRQSAIESLLVEIKAGRINIDAHDKMSRENPNYPSSIEFAKSLLYRANEAIEIKIPQKPFQTSSEIYNYLGESLRDIAQDIQQDTSKKVVYCACKPHGPRRVSSPIDTVDTCGYCGRIIDDSSLLKRNSK